MHRFCVRPQAWLAGLATLLLSGSPTLAANRAVTNSDGATLRVLGSDGAWLAQRLRPAPTARPAASTRVAETGDVHRRESTDPQTGRTVDAEGRTHGGPEAAQTLSASPSATVTRVTIDRMSVRPSFGYPVTYDGAGFELMSAADRYYLSDGTDWASGAGSFTESFGRGSPWKVSQSSVSAESLRALTD